MDSNNIDKLFQEKLKNLETPPNARVWNNIESKLSQKKRKVLPIWWFTSGAAAIFLLAFFLLPQKDHQNTIPKTNIIITETPKKLSKPASNTPENTFKLNTNKKREKNNVIAKKVLPKKNYKTRNKKTSKDEENTNLVSTKNAMEKFFLADNNTKNVGDTPAKKEKEKAIDTTRNNNDNRNIDFLQNKTKPLDFIKSIAKKDSVFNNIPEEKRWSVAPVFAVLNSNSFSKTVPVQQNLSNAVQGENSFSYGIQVGYQINSKWTIRSGIHIQETRFSNNNVLLTSIASNSFFSSIVFDDTNFSIQQTSNGSETGNTPFADNMALTADVSQNYGYIEVPVEVKYNFFSTRKFNSEIVGGFSSLFLNSNEVNVNTILQSNSGELNNLNTVNFSGNFGFDFNYLFHKNWSLNVNPMFKAQLNTFTENSNGLSPFNVGIYTGLKYQF